MPPKSPGSSYSGKPVRRLKLPKIGPPKTKSLFEEYFYALLAVVFFGVAILGKAAGFSTYNAVIVAAWITALIWLVRQLRGYLAEKSKTENGKSVSPPAAAPAQTPKGTLPLAPGMKPMIGPQWPVKPGARPARPGLPRQRATTTSPAPTSQRPAIRRSGAQAPPGETPQTTSDEKKRSFVYERPTLPDRTPRLPNNWPKPDKKKPRQ
ncbi:MAG TPA: hypothetical protein VI431_03065 [Candidatus Acidoferrum sp.]